MGQSGVDIAHLSWISVSKGAELLYGHCNLNVKEIESLIADGMQRMTAIEAVVSEYRNSKYRFFDFLKKKGCVVNV